MRSARRRFRHVLLRQAVPRKTYSILLTSLPCSLQHISDPPPTPTPPTRVLRLPVELVGGHAEKDPDDRVDGDERWSGQKLVLETESVVVPFAVRCAVFMN